MGFTRKKITDETTNWPDEEDMRDIKNFFTPLENVPEGNRVYFDEFYICGNEAPTQGRAPRGQAIYRPREKHHEKGASLYL